MSSERTYRCTQCCHVSSDLSAFTDHMLSHSRYYKYPCKQCNEKFTSTADLRQHSRAHHAKPKTQKKTHPSPVIQKRVSTTTVEDDSAETEPRLHDCPHCDETNMSSYSFLSHASLHTGIYKYICKHCGKGVNHLGNMRKHYWEVHQLKREQVPIEDFENVCWAESVRELYSEVPNFSLSIKALMKREPVTPSKSVTKPMSVTANGRKTTPMPKSRSKSNSNWANKNGLMTKSGGLLPNAIVQCGICKDRVTKQNLRRHIDAKHPEVGTGQGSGMNICSVCFKVFTKAGDLRLHFRQAHEPKKKNLYVRCQYCNDVICKGNLQKHIAAKHPESYKLPPNKCPKCDRRFHSIGPLTRHLAESHDVRPDDKYVVCKFCHEFTLKSSYARHLIVKHPDSYTAPHVCPECGEAYATQGKLNRHRGRIHGKWPEICQVNIAKLDMDTYDAVNGQAAASSNTSEANGDDSSLINGENLEDLIANGDLERMIEADLDSDAASFIMGDIKNEPMSDGEDGDMIEGTGEQQEDYTEEYQD